MRNWLECKTCHRVSLSFLKLLNIKNEIKVKWLGLDGKFISWTICIPNLVKQFKRCKAYKQFGPPPMSNTYLRLDSKSKSYLRDNLQKSMSLESVWWKKILNYYVWSFKCLKLSVERTITVHQGQVIQTICKSMKEI